MSNYILISSDDADAFIAHSSCPWKKHKYISKDGTHYIYSTRESAQIRKQERDILGTESHKAKDILKSKRKVRKLNSTYGDYDIYGQSNSNNKLTGKERAVGKIRTGKVSKAKTDNYVFANMEGNKEGSKDKKQTVKQTSMRGVKVKKESAMDKAVRKATIKRRRLY